MGYEPTVLLLKEPCVCAAGAAVTPAVPRCHRPPNAPKSRRRHRDKIPRGCVWVIKAAYDFALLLFWPWWMKTAPATLRSSSGCSPKRAGRTP